MEKPITKSVVYQVSDENLLKVEDFFVRKVKETGSKSLEATVVDIADGSGVALATAHKAIKELSKKKIIDIIRPQSRRFAITYVYHGDIQGFNDKKEDNFQLDYLKDLVQQMKEEIAELNKNINLLEGENRILTNVINNNKK
jgi:DNA-binding MarR family transcriptional regulator